MVDTSRKPGRSPAHWGRILLFTTAMLTALAGRSEADFGFGFGFGFENNAAATTNMLNSWSLQNGATAAAARPLNLTAPRFQVRDEGFFDRYDLATREAMVNRLARNPGREMRTINPDSVRPTAPRVSTPAPSPTPAAVKPQPAPVVLLADFFAKDRSLVWPSNAPVTGEMGGKREIADQAILAVLNEYELQGLAQLSSVTAARQKLLDYGRPALDYVRNQTTPVMADAFHNFLLSLYTNVGLAATVPKAR